ncbi:gamma-glutamylcyclotransferase [Geodermatophilus ruber]|uniref:AIG2-like family protein n=1 Tax=Geodermatophilus ruber TaxID=504800 RepID=A0A1I4L406_9ACTN|nr:gamma-glutamylcyclotransferase [Geodermatophilus ruber]SFL85778.1 AIG2-like family protein [Geodermatophilus ruber]
MGLYAAYGSNMDAAQMLRRCPSSPHLGTGWIRGWRLTFGGEDLGWEGALATLVPDDTLPPDAPPSEALSPGVFVALYDLTEADERALDAWEGGDIDLYRKLHLRVHTLTGDAVAFVYVLDAFEGGLPSARYLGALADAAESAGAPDDYLAELRTRECRSTGL